jgi:hypothetical protein
MIVGVVGMVVAVGEAGGMAGMLGLFVGMAVGMVGAGVGVPAEMVADGDAAMAPAPREIWGCGAGGGRAGRGGRQVGVCL